MSLLEVRDDREEVALADIVQIPEMQVRGGTHRGTVKKYALAMRNGQELPPLSVAQIVGNDSLILIDGFHRIEALRQNGERSALVRVVVAASLEDARYLAFAANSHHGLPLKQSLRREGFRAYIAAGRHILKPGAEGPRRFKSYRVMATELGNVSHNAVRNWAMEDAPDLFAALGGVDRPSGKGGLPEALTAEELLYNEVRAGLEQAGAALPGVRDPMRRYGLHSRLKEMLSKMEADGSIEVSPF